MVEHQHTEEGDNREKVVQFGGGGGGEGVHNMLHKL